MWYVVTEYGVPKAVFERKSGAEKAVENRPGEIHPVVKCETAAKFLSDTKNNLSEGDTAD